MKKKIPSIILLSLLGCGLILSVPGAYAIGNRTTLRANKLTSINNLLSEDVLTCLYRNYETVGDFHNYSYNDVDNEIKNYLSNLTWEKCDRNFGLPKNYDVYDDIFIGGNGVTLSITENYGRCVIDWDDELNYFSAYSYYKIDSSHFESLKDIIVTKGTRV